MLDNKNVKSYIFFFVVIFLGVTLSVGLLKKYHSLGGRERIYNHDRRSNLSVDRIQSWMTFDYINRTFNLPESYLQEKFFITSSDYPHTTIQSLAEDRKLEKASLLLQVQGALYEYKTSYKNNAPSQ